jgi:hypothetical protein
MNIEMMDRSGPSPASIGFKNSRKDLVVAIVDAHTPHTFGEARFVPLFLVFGKLPCRPGFLGQLQSFLENLPNVRWNMNTGLDFIVHWL